jgi:hypothetical protein
LANCAKRKERRKMNEVRNYEKKRTDLEGGNDFGDNSSVTASSAQQQGGHLEETIRF